MHETLQKDFDQALDKYSKGKYYQKLLTAKKQFFELTGSIDEDDDNFEARMDAFNEWYLFQCALDEDGTDPLMFDYIEKNGLDDIRRDAFSNVAYSLYEYHGPNFRKFSVVKDLVHKKKYLLAKDHCSLGLIKGELFTGRLITYSDSNYIMSGICVLAKEVKGLLKRPIRKVRKAQSKEDEIAFLLKVELFAQKWKRYAHLPADKIFIFD